MLAPYRKLFILCSIAITFSGFAQTTGNDLPNGNKTGQAIPGNHPTGIKKTKDYHPLSVSSLSATMAETSGLIVLQGQLWTINDGGNPAEIYQIDTSNGKVLRTVVISNAANFDWESLTQDSSNIYIGDFGNNTGNRMDLRILKILAADLLNGEADTVKASSICFRYPDQTTFIRGMNQTNFDCEAFFFHNDSLHLFSKDWTDLQTRHYILPADTGNWQARLVEQFNADGLITDAAINKKGEIVLLGYKNTGGRSYTCFAWLLSGYAHSLYFSGAQRRVELGSALHLGQTEGIVLNDDATGWISAESIESGWFYETAKLFRFDFHGLF